MKRGKNAQFYIIAAIIIVLVVLGMAGVSNYVTVTEEPTEFYELGENLELEGAWIVDYGLYSGGEISTQIENFTKDLTTYLAETGEDFELVIIYGDEKLSCTRKYERGSKGTINLESVGQTETEGVIFSDPNCSERNQVNLEISNISYNIDVKENENFLFVISTSEGLEDHIYSNI